MLPMELCSILTAFVAQLQPYKALFESKKKFIVRSPTGSKVPPSTYQYTVPPDRGLELFRKLFPITLHEDCRSNRHDPGPWVAILLLHVEFEIATPTDNDMSTAPPPNRAIFPINAHRSSMTFSPFITVRAPPVIDVAVLE